MVCERKYVLCCKVNLVVEFVNKIGRNRCLFTRRMTCLYSLKAWMLPLARLLHTFIPATNHDYDSFHANDRSLNRMFYNKKKLSRN